MKILNYLKRTLSSPSKFPLYMREMGVEIGEGCHVYNTVKFFGEPYLIKIGNHVRINAGVELITHDGGLWVLRNLQKRFEKADLFGKIVIEDNVHIGTNAIIMPGVTIGRNSIVACGAVVTKSAPPNSVIAGVPAKVIESIEEYADKVAPYCVSTKGMSKAEKKGYIISNIIPMKSR